MPALTQTQTNARLLPVGRVIQKNPLLKKGPGVLKKSIVAEITNGVHDGKGIPFCVSTYNSANETLVHLTKATIVWPNGAETGGYYNDSFTVTNDGIELKLGMNAKCLKEGHYDKMLANTCPTVLFTRKRKEDEFRSTGTMRYIDGSFIAKDPTCRRGKKNEAQPTARFRMLDVTTDMVRRDPGLLMLPKRV